MTEYTDELREVLSKIDEEGLGYWMTDYATRGEAELLGIPWSLVKDFNDAQMKLIQMIEEMWDQAETIS